MYKKAIILSITFLLFSPSGAVANDHSSLTAAATLKVYPYNTLPQQIGYVARDIMETADTDIKKLAITPVFHGIRGHTINILRADLEQAANNNHGSPEEIWQHVTTEYTPSGDPTGKVYDGTNTAPALPLPFGFQTRLILDNQASLNSGDNGISFRTSALAEIRKQMAPHILIGSDWRLNIADNLSRSARNNPVRSNTEQFTDSTVSADRLFVSWLGNIGENTTASVTAGYLEEMYGGFGGEILYRPFEKTFAFGVEAYHAYKRDPDNGLNMRFTGENTTTAFLNGWYEIPGTDMTLHGRIGRYLDKDFGGTLSLQKRMDNGTFAEAFLTGTDSDDLNTTGNSSHIYGGLRLHIPTHVLTGQKNILPAGSEIRMDIEPLERDAGQSLALPVSLYEITEPLSFRHLGHHWPSLLPY